jgi:hypothetical protein
MGGCQAGGFFTYGKATPPASKEAGYSNRYEMGMLEPGSSDPGIFFG